ncbi:conserved membrane hypothetical protein [Bosea sp. 62]|uniref:phosphopantetheine adenylyltransferase n=1 Tax=unclassified Bosea (in: a-proteobacteria) TaxID=2653178 RepID=UPI0012532E6A|nr:MULTISPECIES: phosphopantetheine adenylyltransferase [unclassified Bosea (in: a-proteobacteria)]CAD5251009.1 conserved membrane hypothetical protein [Bosea sp. 21B]CAD5262677.1 conserved membrane hypothetical protein [Bosea sp. 7B]CAD5271984.1 conserved membrane hypothetical protein [Bosea sp. 46]VVT43760.1 conserved membrane hypothetical protein [Bosea sp. EC-HK365B]VXB20246.1 conserved membrane hypothetical protein [Bosea sp. 29B]
MAIPAKLVPVGLVIAGIVNLLPTTGVAGVGWLRSLYGFEIANPDLEILLRHRAVLFGLVGVLLLAAAIRPGLRDVAVLVAGASMASFIVIALLVGGYGPAISKVVIADVIGLIALVPTIVARLAPSHR